MCVISYKVVVVVTEQQNVVRLSFLSDLRVQTIEANSDHIFACTTLYNTAQRNDDDGDDDNDAL